MTSISNTNHLTFYAFRTVFKFKVSEKIIIHDCPDEVEVVENELNTMVFWTPPTAELLTINGSIHLERRISSNGSNSDPGDNFPVGSTQVEYNYQYQEETASCIFTVIVGNCLFAIIVLLLLLLQLLMFTVS